MRAEKKFFRTCKPSESLATMEVSEEMPLGYTPTKRKKMPRKKKMLEHSESYSEEQWRRVPGWPEEQVIQEEGGELQPKEFSGKEVHSIIDHITRSLNKI